MYNKKLYIIFFISCATFTLVGALINSYIINDTEKPQAVKRTVKENPKINHEPDIRPSTAKKRYPLIPEDPKKYGMISYPEDIQPLNQNQWDSFMKQALEKSGVLDQESAKKALEQSKKTPEEYRARAKEIEDRIAVYEKRKKEGG